ncbi:MAG: hypothetical protein MST00_00305 [Tenericutes bacterium]|nr:hypothetical protein [Mycoplasmatota bacterium]
MENNMEKETKKRTASAKKTSDKVVKKATKAVSKAKTASKKTAKKVKDDLAKTKTVAKKEIASAKKTVNKEIKNVKKAAATKEKQIKKDLNNLEEEIATKKAATLNSLNEVKNNIEENITNKIEENLNVDQCKYCHKFFDKGLTVCPHCRKNQNISTVSTVITILIAIFALLLLFTYFFMDNQNKNKLTPEEYKSTCVLVSYEDLVRSPKNTMYKTVKLIGKVVSVEGHDNGITGNSMIIKINVNLFANQAEQIVEIKFNDKDYKQGFLTNDLIEVYGKYTQINGNVPTIEAEYIDFSK